MVGLVTYTHLRRFDDAFRVGTQSFAVLIYQCRLRASFVHTMKRSATRLKDTSSVAKKTINLTKESMTNIVIRSSQSCAFSSLPRTN